MTKQEIKSQLVLKGITYRQLAKKLGVHYTAITLVINQQKTSRRIQEAIAAAIDKPFNDVWPRRSA